MTSKEIWTIDDIIKDYEEKGGISSRSKIDFLETVKKDLEVLEILKTQEQEKILEILKPRIYIEEGLYREDFQDDRLRFGKDFFDSVEQYDKLKEWLENE